MTRRADHHTLINGLRERDASIGLETMCVGGGQGMAMISNAQLSRSNRAGKPITAAATGGPRCSRRSE